MRPVTIKICFSILLLAVSIFAFGWRILNPGILTSFTGMGTLYCLLILSLLPIVTVIGWFGAQLTFPVGKKE
jgi:hypothetical protein